MEEKKCSSKGVFLGPSEKLRYFIEKFMSRKVRRGKIRHLPNKKIFSFKVSSNESLPKHGIEHLLLILFSHPNAAIPLYQRTRASELKSPIPCFSFKRSSKSWLHTHELQISHCIEIEICCP